MKPWKQRVREMCERRRVELIERLGGKCEICKSRKKLEIDHPHGRDWKVEKVASHMRIKIYEAEAARGEVRLLCSDCNKRNPPLPF